MPRDRKQSETMSALLRQAINNSKLSFPEIERATGVVRASLMRFASGEGSLRLDMADKLADFFGFEVVQRTGAASDSEIKRRRKK